MAMDSSAHDQLREQTGLYVLGALTPQERAAFEAHLATCAECAAEVRSLTPVVGALGQTAPQIEPPRALRTRVLSASGARSSAGGSEAGIRAASIGFSEKWLAVAASLLIAVAFGAYALQLRGRVSLLEERLRDAVLRAEAAESRMAEVRRVSSEAQSQIAVLTAPDVVRVDLAGQPPAPSASARAFWSRSRGLVFTASNLPPLPTGRVYQLWVLTAKPVTPISAGLLRPDSGGGTTGLFTLSPDVPPLGAMAVTIEPEGGVPAPTGEMYVAGSVPSL